MLNSCSVISVSTKFVKDPFIVAKYRCANLMETRHSFMFMGRLVCLNGKDKRKIYHPGRSLVCFFLGGGGGFVVVGGIFFVNFHFNTNFLLCILLKELSFK